MNPFMLLIEDDKSVITIVKNNLAASGVLRNHLSACQSIEEAIAFLHAHPEFAIILLDASLPDGMGLAGLKKLKAIFPTKIIIVLADHAHQHLGIDFIRTGAQDLILKEVLANTSIYPTIQFAVERIQLIQQEVVEKVSKVKKTNQQLYQDIFNKSKDAIYICNLEGRLVDFNQATFELFAFSEEELLEIEIHNLFHTKEKKREFLYALVANQSVIEFPMEIEQKNGKIRKCLISASMIRTPEFTGYSGLLKDITEQKKADDLRKARDIARQSAKMKEQFIAT